MLSGAPPASLGVVTWILVPHEQARTNDLTKTREQANSSRRLLICIQHGARPRVMTHMLSVLSGSFRFAATERGLTLAAHIDIDIGCALALLANVGGRPRRAQAQLRVATARR